MNYVSKNSNFKFNRLSLAHYRKIELSKLIDKYPGEHTFYIKD